MNISVILPAAGLGRRFSVGETFGGDSGLRASSSKIEFELLSKPVFLRTIESFQGIPDVGQIILAVNPDKLDDFRFRWGDQLDFQGVQLIAGGVAERWETVQLALKQVADDATHIAVHDAARPCASPEMMQRVFAAAEKYGAAVPGLAMSDTVKRAKPGDDDATTANPLDAIFGDEASATIPTHAITETVPRNGLFRVQTPQVFEKQLITEAYTRLNAENAAGVTDDASAAEQAGHTVTIVEGDPLNLKLTQPVDVELLEAVIAMREAKAAKKAAVKQLFGDDDDD